MFARSAACNSFPDVNAILYYAPVIFEHTGLSHSSALEQTIFIGVINVLSTFMAVLYVARPGFEPRQTEPKSVVLPLYYRAILKELFERGCKNKSLRMMFQI